MKKNNLLTIQIIIIFTLMNLLIPHISHAQDINYSGVWKLNQSKSEFGSVPSAAAAQSYKVEQHAKDITLTWTTLNGDQQISSTQRLPLNGKQVDTLLVPSNRTRTSSIFFDTDGKTIVFIKSYSRPNAAGEPDYTIKEHWQMSNDHKELLIELVSPRYTINAVYDKQD